MAFGLTNSGFQIKRLADIRSDVEDALKAEFGEDFNVGADSAAAQITAPIYAQLALVWELAEQVYLAFDPDQNTGDAQNNTAVLTGLLEGREPATFSTGTLTLTGDANTDVPDGTIVENPTTEDRFETVEAVTIGSSGSVDVSIVALETGPLEASAGSITNIITPVAGLDSVTNAADIIPGQNEETDAELRLRRNESLAIGGIAVDLAIKAELLDTTGVTEALILSNRSSTTDALGIPGKSFRSVIWPSSVDADYQTDIAETIFRAQPAGIQPDGAQTVEVTDEEGFTQNVSFSFAEEQVIQVDVTVTTTSDYPSDGDTQVTDAVVASTDFSVGEDVNFLKVACGIKDDVAGIDTLSIDFTNTTTGDPAVTDGNIAIALTEIATVDEGDISVTSS